MQVKVALSLNLNETLTYAMPPDLLERTGIGSRVVVPLGNRLQTGWIVAQDSDYSGRTRMVAGWINDSFRLTPIFIEFVLHAAGRFLAAPGILMDGALSPRRRNRRQIRMVSKGKPGPVLSTMGAAAIRAAGNGRPVEFVLSSRTLGRPGPWPDPVNGQGFTEKLILDYNREPHYRDIVDACLDRSESVLILTAETRVADGLSETLSGVQAYHSALAIARREALWERAVSADPVAVAGGQSALLLPFYKLGAIIVDQSGGRSIRSGERENLPEPELARLLAAVRRIPLITGDHTYPIGVFRRRSFVTVENRLKTADVETRVIPLKPGLPGIPAVLMEGIAQHVKSGRRVLIVINRVQGGGFLFCAKCRRMARCPHCREALLPGDTEELPEHCPLCGGPWKTESRCPRCGEEWVRVSRINLESLGNELEEKLLGVAPPLITAASGDDEVRRAVENEMVVLGTRTVVRPEFRHRFQAILYIRPEADFHFSEYDAAERIQCMVGRLRDLVVPGGKVDVFTTFHFHYGLKLLDSREAFLEKEAKYRRWFRLPPYADEFLLVFRDTSARKVACRMRRVRARIGEHLVIREARLESRIPRRGKITGRMIVSGSLSALRISGILDQREIKVSRKT